MAYIPDEWVMGNLEIAPSAQRLLFYYCGRADHDSGETNVSAQRCSQDLGIRKDHVDEHDRKLIREGFIKIVRDENGARVVSMLSPWQPRAERNGFPVQKAEKKTASQVLVKDKQVATQDLGSPLDSFPSFGENPQVLGEVTQVLGKSPQVLGAHIGITSPCNQPIEPGSCADAPVTSGRKKTSSKKPTPPKSEFHNHPSVVAYRDIAGFKAVNAEQALLIAEATGKDLDQPPENWLRFVKDLAKAGNRHTANVQVMVWAYERYETGACLAEALDSAWSKYKGRASSNGNGGVANGAVEIPRPPVVKAPADYFQSRQKGAE